MASPLETAISELTEIQRTAVNWDQNALLVLAGPGSGKTQVLTCRIARLLDSSRDKKFRVLALTFTNKAADEMKERVAAFVPGLESRAVVGTFHGFCSQVLRQHGIHIDIKPDFTIYSDDEDRREILQDALRRAKTAGKSVGATDVHHLAIVDRLKANLVPADSAEKALSQYKDRIEIASAYRAYEEELRRLNALDFNSLILEAYRLVTRFPAIAARYRSAHPYWLVDEFQDTNGAQYKLIRGFAGNEFRNIFAVADDDQIIYRWNGASFRQIQAFIADFAAEVIQLPTNYRCPPAIVEAANRLVAYNAERTASKKPLIAGKTQLKFPPSEHIQTRVFPSEDEEAAGIAKEIAGHEKNQWGETAVLARTRALLERMHSKLRDSGVPSIIAQRRDDFLSAEFRWFIAVLTQVVRPLDRRNFGTVVEAYNRLAGQSISTEQIITDAETTGSTFLQTWIETVRKQVENPELKKLLDATASLTQGTAAAKQALNELPAEFEKKLSSAEADSDLAEDMRAWRELTRDIARHIGRDIPLDQFLQELQLRSKEPAPKKNTVTLMTIHGAKGKEFDFVYLIGLAEDIMPSFQSKQRGDKSPEMEEERRNCFVAITRTKECLVLSHAEKYRGWNKPPSRFLVEMGLEPTGASA
jgi:DNA helicase II / ATP-dependent DNA helicase PcrA